MAHSKDQKRGNKMPYHNKAKKKSTMPKKKSRGGKKKRG
jgi:hypothetical protein